MTTTASEGGTKRKLFLLLIFLIMLSTFYAVYVERVSKFEHSAAFRKHILHKIARVNPGEKGRGQPTNNAKDNVPVRPLPANNAKDTASARPSPQPTEKQTTTTVRSNETTQTHPPVTTAAPKPTNIVVWIPMFGVKNADNKLSEDCGECIVTYNRTKVNDAETKAVVFHFHVNIMNDIPEKRRPDQFYVWWALESCLTVKWRGHSLNEFDHFFNLSMTYRRDSDVWAPYKDNWKKPDKALTEEDIDQLISKKTGLALWIASNCGATKGARQRMQLVKDLMALGLNIQRGGACSPGGRRDSYDFGSFKFYLSFENSWYCKDYITEKFWRNGLNYGSVPIVVGPPKEDYLALAPPGSFIHVHDFETTQKLVDYINYLDGNATAYREYFKWMSLSQEEMDPDLNKPRTFCKLCRVVKGMMSDDIHNTTVTKRKEPKVISSLKDWWYGKENPKCLG